MKILALSPRPTHPQNAGNTARIYNLLHTLREKEHDVHFVHIGQVSGDVSAMREFWKDRYYALPYALPQKPDALKRLIKQCIPHALAPGLYRNKIDDWYDSGIDQFVYSLHRKIRFDAVLVEYVFFSKALEMFDSSVLKIIDTHDVFTGRHHMLRKAGIEPRWFSTSAQEEKKGLERADIIIAMQKNDADFFRKLCRKKVITIGYLAPLHNRCAPVSQNTRALLFIGSDNIINIEAVRHFLKRIFPETKKLLPGITLLLAGKVSEHFHDEEGCLSLGVVNSLEKTYAQADIVINPVQAGTGMSIKLLEALGYSKPCVSTRAGARGAESGMGKAFLVAESDHDFAARIKYLFDNRQIMESISHNAYLFAKKWNEENTAALESAFSLHGHS